jgi:hypothetical protein
VLNEAGLTRIGQARHVPSEDLIELLDPGGYARYDFRATSRLQAQSELVDERYDGRAPGIGRQHQAYPALRTALTVLPGWGPVTCSCSCASCAACGPARSHRWIRAPPSARAISVC